MISYGIGFAAVSITVREKEQTSYANNRSKADRELWTSSSRNNDYEIILSFMYD